MYCGSTTPTDASALHNVPDATRQNAVGAATRSVMRLVLALVEESAAGAARICDDADSRAGWQELRNKVEAFRAFEHVDTLLGASMSSPLTELLARARELRRPLSVWAAEGIGYHMTAARSSPRGLLQRRDVADWAQVPLHAGLGSAIAASVLDPVLRTGADFDAAVHAIETFDMACRANADAAHLGVALEALGFSVRAMYAELVTLVSAALESARVDLVPYFWHGAGRAMYFAPTAACPVTATPQQGLDEALMSPPPEQRGNAIAGFTWAATLVNLRHPYVVERVVSAVAAKPRWIPAGSAGIQSALEVWRRCAPGDGAIDDFLGHQPYSPPARDAWYRVVVAAPRPQFTRAGDLFALPSTMAGAAL
jgi:hypothetical protein